MSAFSSARFRGVVSVCLLLTFAPALLAQDDTRQLALGVFKPLPKDARDPQHPLDDARIHLGAKLFMETRLSKSGTISCNSCHDLTNYGVDNEATSEGHEGKRGTRNSPSVYNAALHMSQFWDGRAKDVEEQALGPVMNPVEMAMQSEADIEKIFMADPEYAELFATAFPGEKEPVTFKNIGRAIGAFERTLITRSRFDRYLEGDDDALDEVEKRGLRDFVATGCATCHNGATLGGQMYQKLGLVKPYQTKDLGRYEHTKSEADKYLFKVPSLRNIEKTSPYFHDGSIGKLEDAVRIMAEHQLGKVLSEPEVGSITAFLRSLTGELPKDVLGGAKATR